MELFTKQIVNDLKPFQGLWLFSECNFSPLQGERCFCSNRRGCSKNFHQNLWKIPLKIFLKNCRLGVYSFTKNEVIHRCSTRILVPPSAGSFTDSHFQAGSFEVLISIFCGTKITLEWTTPPPPPLCLSHPLILKFFQPPPPPTHTHTHTHTHIIQYFKDSISADTSKMIVSIWRNIWYLSADKKSKW